MKPFRYIEELIEERRNLERLLKLSPKVTRLIQIDRQTWIIKRCPDMPDEEEQKRFIQRLDHSRIHNWFK